MLSLLCLVASVLLNRLVFKKLSRLRNTRRLPPKNIKNIDNNYLIQTLNALTTDKNLAHVLNAANPKFAKYSNGPIEGINRKIKLLRRLSFDMPNFTNMKKRLILWLNFKPKNKDSKKIALIS